jgi:hypothetical protein
VVGRSRCTSGAAGGTTRTPISASDEPTPPPCTRTWRGGTPSSPPPGACGRGPASRWTSGAGDDDAWAYRRDPRITRPWDDAVLRSPDGVPYLAPELQLLFKSRTVRPRDQQDAEVVIPRLGPERRTALGSLLAADHPWQALLRDAG